MGLKWPNPKRREASLNLSMVYESISMVDESIFMLLFFPIAFSKKESHHYAVLRQWRDSEQSSISPFHGQDEVPE
jgi:hypothetical protein